MGLAFIMTSSSCLWKQQTFLPAKLVQSLHHWCPQNLFWATQSSFNIILAQSYFKITLFKIRWNTSWLFIDNETSDSTISGQDILYSIVVNNEMLTDDHFYNLTLQLFLRLKLFYLSILMTDLKLSCLKKFTEKYNNKMMHDLILNSSSRKKVWLGSSTTLNDSLLLVFCHTESLFGRILVHVTIFFQISQTF